VPGTDDDEQPTPSDDVAHYALKVGAAFQPPLMEYLYGDEPKGFWHLPRASRATSGPTPMPVEPSTMDTAFTGQFAGKATWADDWLKCVVTQHCPTIPHVKDKFPRINWRFNFPEMLQGVIVNVAVWNPVLNKYPVVAREGRIVAYVDDSIDHPPRFRVRIAAPTS